MKTQTLIGILFTLLDRQRVSAGELAQKYNCSVRSILRYADELTCSGIPIDVVRGANGGIGISDAFKLPRGLLTREEAARLHEALLAINEQLRDPALSAAVKKFEARYVSGRTDAASLGNILVDSGSWGMSTPFPISSLSSTAPSRNGRNLRSTTSTGRANAPAATSSPIFWCSNKTCGTPSPGAGCVRNSVSSSWGACARS